MVLTQKEIESIRAFEKEHKPQHEPWISMAVEFSPLEIVIRENSIGHTVIVRCVLCWAMHDVTDLDAW